MKSPVRLSAVVVVALAGALTLVGCGSSKTSSAPSSSGAPTTSDTTAAAAAIYKATDVAPPTSGPAPQAGKSVWIVSCGQASVGCATGAQGAADAARLVGWKSTVCDGKLDAGNAFATCVQQGLATKPSVILTEAIDCVAIKPALQQAIAAHIPVINFWGFDCNDPFVNAGPALFTASVSPSAQTPTNEAYQTAIGKARADWIISQSSGTAKVVEVDFQGTSIGHYLHQGFADEMKTCSGCSVYDTPVTLQSLANLRATVQSALLRHPNATYVASPLDSLVLLGVGPAVTGSSSSSKVKVIGGEGLAPNLDLIRSGKGENAAVAQPIAWWGYAAIDTANRLFHNQPAVPEGLGLQVVDSTHNLPASGPYVSPVDYVADYTTLWGKG